MTSIAEVSQRLAVGDLVQLFILDLTPIGVDGIYRFTNSITGAGEKVSFGGEKYTAVDFETEGWEYNGKGAFPRPRMRVSNVGGFLSGLLYQYGDLVGAEVTRIRTFAEFLDGMPNADSSIIYPPDIYRVFQKIRQNKKLVEIELSAAVDEEEAKIPARKIFRDTCMHDYRRYVEGAWDYTTATCPYTGSACFTRDGVSTDDPSADVCGRQLSDCQLRFGSDPLPTRAFPGVSRSRY
ncbi:conserved hypothetical protein [uncultured Pleomorphomonas sp.]|uniref:Phage minor tail protein L n=1 Tax=uncultured Pleomorphomonas sp. TaxID=442121 RepID=A0A212L1P5_9HYPH|nr:phage minor tail protein L [uncultured Pleomorphomonas sp.]SCM71481.1 conserved hypothetical protein [uncultured Pleomorphomonas sp.]